MAAPIFLFLILSSWVTSAHAHLRVESVFGSTDQVLGSMASDRVLSGSWKATMQWSLLALQKAAEDTSSQSDSRRVAALTALQLAEFEAELRASGTVRNLTANYDTPATFKGTKIRAPVVFAVKTSGQAKYVKKLEALYDTWLGKLPPAERLVERFDIEPFPDFSAK